MNFNLDDHDAGGEVHLISLTGEVDLYTAPDFKQKIIEVVDSGKRRVIVDLTRVTFIDSTTLGVLVGAVKRLRPLGGSLELVCDDRNILKIFEITGLDRVFTIHATREDAGVESGPVGGGGATARDTAGEPAA